MQISQNTTPLLHYFEKPYPFVFLHNSEKNKLIYIKI